MLDYESLSCVEDAGFAGGAFTVKARLPSRRQLFRADRLLPHGKNGSIAPKVLLISVFVSVKKKRSPWL